MALSSNHEIIRTPSDIAVLGIAREIPVATLPLTKTDSPSERPASPVVEKMRLIPKGDSIPEGGRIVTIEDDGSRIVGSPATPEYEENDVLIQAIKHPEPVSQPLLPPSDYPFVNLGRFFKQIYYTIKFRWG